MNHLKFDLEGAKAQLTQVFRDRISAQGSVYNVQNADIHDVDFAELEKAIANQDQLIAEMKTDLQQAQTHGGRWFNEVQPHLSAIPQAAINYATLWSEAIPTVLTQLGQPQPDRAQLRELFRGLRRAIDDQTSSLHVLATSIQDIKTGVSTDAANFSDKHAAFQQLEALDNENVTAARTALSQIALMIAELDEEIGIDTIEAENDLAIASNVMKVAGLGGNAGKSVGITIGLIFIVSASRAIDELTAAVEARLDEAQQRGEFELELSSLTAQLVALQTASAALAALNAGLDDMIDSVQKTITGWTEDAADIDAIVADLSGSQPVSSILDQLDVTQALAQWSALSSFATKWQSMEISAKSTNELVLDADSKTAIVRTRLTPHLADTTNI